MLGACRHHQGREVLVREGYPADHFLSICSGRVKLVASSGEGRLFLLRVVGPGDTVGLAALLQGDAYRVTAETIVPSCIKTIPRAAFLGFMGTHPDASRIASLSLAREYNSAVLAARRLALHTSAAGKLASTLLDWASMDEINDSPVPTSLPVSFLMQLTHEELGNMAGISRETVSRLLVRFRRDGQIQQIHNRMILKRPDQLEARYN